jgi:integrase
LRQSKTLLTALSAAAYLSLSALGQSDTASTPITQALVSREDFPTGVDLSLAPQQGTQTTDAIGFITGSVMDPTGAGVVGAKVTATRTDTGQRTTVTTNGCGFYVFPSLPPGQYTVKVAAPGFQTFVETNVTLTMNQPTRVDAKLKVGAATTTVQVQASAPASYAALDSSSATRTSTPLIEVPQSVEAITHLDCGAGRPYQTDWAHFSVWCGVHGRQELPASPVTVALYLADHASRHKPATLNRRLAAMVKVHTAAGFGSPASIQHAAVSETMKGIRRVQGIAQAVRTPLLTADLQQVLVHLPPGVLGLRDRALLLTGYCGGLRRAELAALAVGDLAWSDEGIAICIRRSKTDQEGAGRSLALPRGTHPKTCPVRAIEAWMAAAGITREQKDQPLFRAVNRKGRAAALHPNTVAKIVKRAVEAAGYDPALYAGHSLRAGFATQAARNGASAFDIMRQTGHRSIAMVARYVRDVTLFVDTPAGKLGL